MDARAVMPGGAIVSQNVAPWIERLARVGFAAKGVLYLTIGALAASAALGGGGRTDADSHSAMDRLLEAPFGRLLLAVIAVGLVGYAVWRIIQAIKDPERRGNGAAAIAVRTGFFIRGVIHLGLAGTAAGLALWQRDGGGGGGERAQQGTAEMLRIPGGVYLVWAVAAAFAAYGLYQLFNAARSKLSKQLALGRLSPGTRRWVIGISRFGIAARGVVFGTIGILLARAANQADAREAGGVGASLQELGGLGKWPFLAIALGVVAYGIYELINARYRRIDVR